jgi:hypothetical protein
MKSYKDLPENEREQLLKFPAYISLLAANYHNNGMDQKEKETAIEFTHIETFSSNPQLRDFFEEAEKNFEKTITLLNDQLPKKKKEREVMIRAELGKLGKILSQLGTEYSSAMLESMEAYKKHIAHAHDSLMEYLVFPIPIKGLTF